MKKKAHLHLLLDVERKRVARELHNLRVKRLIIGTSLIVVGTVIPEFHPIMLHVVATDTLKGIGYIPILKLVEDVFMA